MLSTVWQSVRKAVSGTVGAAVLKAVCRRMRTTVPSERGNAPRSCVWKPPLSKGPVSGILLHTSTRPCLLLGLRWHHAVHRLESPGGRADLQFTQLLCHLEFSHLRRHLTLVMQVRAVVRNMADPVAPQVVVPSSMTLRQRIDVPERQSPGVREGATHRDVPDTATQRAILRHLGARPRCSARWTTDLPTTGGPIWCRAQATQAEKMLTR